MTTQNTQTLTVVPAGDDRREIFYKRLNEYINLQYAVESAQEAQKDILEAIAEDHVAIHDTDKKSEVKSQTKLLIEEHLKGKISSQEQKLDAAKGDYETVKKHLNG